MQAVFPVVHRLPLRFPSNHRMDATTLRVAKL